MCFHLSSSYVYSPTFNMRAVKAVKYSAQSLPYLTPKTAFIESYVS